MGRTDARTHGRTYLRYATVRKVQEGKSGRRVGGTRSGWRQRLVWRAVHSLMYVVQATRIAVHETPFPGTTASCVAASVTVCILLTSFVAAELRNVYRKCPVGGHF